MSLDARVASAAFCRAWAESEPSSAVRLRICSRRVDMARIAPSGTPTTLAMPRLVSVHAIPRWLQ